jgi:hypothetical protein
MKGFREKIAMAREGALSEWGKAFSDLQRQVLMRILWISPT